MDSTNIPEGGGAPPALPLSTGRPPIVLCRKCGRPIDPLFAYCPYCGQRQRSGDAWCYDPLWIAVLALFVLGPFALPLVWRSARMGRGAKLAFAAGILAYTAFTVYFAYQAVAYELRMFGELGDLLR